VTIFARYGPVFLKFSDVEREVQQNLSLRPCAIAGISNGAITLTLYETYSTGWPQFKVKIERLVIFYSGHILEMKCSITAAQHPNLCSQVLDVASTGIAWYRISLTDCDRGGAQALFLT
jgi:hypothetical protein